MQAAALRCRGAGLSHNSKLSRMETCKETSDTHFDMQERTQSHLSSPGWGGCYSRTLVKHPRLGHRGRTCRNA